MKPKIFLPFLFSIAALSVMTNGCVSFRTDPTEAEADLSAARDERAKSLENHMIPIKPYDGGHEQLLLSDEELSFADAIKIALENNLDLQAVVWKKQEARGAIMEARSAAFPSLGITGSFSSDLTSDSENTETTSIGAELSQAIWRSGAVGAGIKYAQLYAANIDYEIENATQCTILAAADAYWQVLLANEMVGVYEEGLNVSKRMLATARDKVRAGTATRYDELRAEVEVATAQAELINQSNVLNTAGVELVRILGINPSSSILLTGKLDYSQLVVDTAEQLALAIRRRPDLLQAEANVRMAKAALAVAESSYGPSADLFFRGEYANPDPNDRARDEWDTSATVGARVTWKAFDGLERKGKLTQQKAALERAKAQLRAAEKTAYTQVIKAIADLENAEKVYLAQRTNVSMAKEALRIIESGYKLGRNTQLEVLDASSTLTGAHGDYLRAVYAHCLARLNLRKATGSVEAKYLEVSEEEK